MLDKYVRDEGIAIGRQENELNLLRLKLAKGQSVEQIADALETTPEYIRELIEKLKEDEVNKE